MKFTMVVTFNRDWVLKHSTDETLYTNNIISAVDGLAAAYELEHSSMTRVEFTVTSDMKPDEFKKELFNVLGELYHETIDDSILGVESALVEENVQSEKSEVAATEGGSDDADEEQTDRKKTAAQYADLMRRLHSLADGSAESDDDGEAGDAEAARAAQKARSDKKRAAEEVLSEIDRLPGSREFKELCYEFAEVAPVLCESGTVDAFASRGYLFVINEGCGLQNDLALFGKLISACNVLQMAKRSVIEASLGPVKESDEPYENIMRTLRMNDYSDAKQFLAVDLSEWLNATDSRHFKNFLVALSKQESFIPVFRIPYVDKYVQDKIFASLSDVLFIRRVVVPPYSRAEMEEYAKRAFAHYGYTLNKAAWSAFFTRIENEHADGKFYGLDTVRKVVMELLYSKQVFDAKNLRRKKAATIDRDGKKVIDGRAAAPILEGFENAEFGTDALKKLVGSDRLERRINEIVAQIELAVKSGGERPCIHMQFVGNPGTGKTTVARIVGRILKERGILSVGNFFEHSGRDFCGKYIGETAPKTSGMCRDAYGSVMFIDEAYSLFRGDGSDRDYGREALDTLIAEMENHRSDFVVIMAGYTDDMKKMMTGNAGLASRVPYTIEFPNFTRDELYDIFASFTAKVTCDDDVLDAARKYFDGLPATVLESKEFSNARFVRNLFERTWAKACTRCQLGGKSDVSLVKDDFERATSDGEFKFDGQGRSRIGFRV
ncbi:MAG: AAA family ATPase [Clostridia bacterium]|nr:AAA family ATPase [Clostridia bacterium]